jgi:hypothetical protein
MLQEKRFFCAPLGLKLPLVYHNWPLTYPFFSAMYYTSTYSVFFAKFSPDKKNQKTLEVLDSGRNACYQHKYIIMRCAKPAQFFVFGSAAIFLLVLISQLTTNRSELEGWVPTGRGSLQTAMEISERLWEKTVNQRREFRKTFPELDL